MCEKDISHAEVFTGASPPLSSLHPPGRGNAFVQLYGFLIRGLTAHTFFFFYSLPLFLSLFSFSYSFLLFPFYILSPFLILTLSLSCL